MKLVDEPVINEYVNRVGQNLVRNSDAKVAFTIKIIESDEVNAMALPGGYPNMLGPDDSEQIPFAYGSNAERLMAAMRSSNF